MQENLVVDLGEDGRFFYFIAQIYLREIRMVGGTSEQESMRKWRKKDFEVFGMVVYVFRLGSFMSAAVWGKKNSLYLYRVSDFVLRDLSPNEKTSSGCRTILKFSAQVHSLVPYRSFEMRGTSIKREILPQEPDFKNTRVALNRPKRGPEGLLMIS